jgi:acetolactate synthase-1/2/3 large subunit
MSGGVEKMSKISGAEMVVKSLEAENVETMFGIPGGAVIPLYDAIYSSKINHILMRHEQAASHAADGYARASGRTGVCIATSGPGATNLVTGIATANIDSVPLVAITGQVGTGIIGTDGFQEADILGITLPVVKHSMQVRSTDQIGPTIKKAFYIASTGRPGVVLVDVPGDIQKEYGEFVYPDTVDDMPGYNPQPIADLTGLDRAADLLESAKRPLIFAGGGVIRSGASNRLVRFAEKLNLPVATSLLGKGAFPESHPLSLRMAGMHGHPVANRALMAADLIVAIGSRFSDRSTGKITRFAPEAHIIHIDLDPAEIGKTVGSDVWLVGDAGEVISSLSGAFADKEFDRSEWLREIREMKEREPLPKNDLPGAISPWQIIEALREITGGKGIVTTEVGQHQMWAAQHYKTESPRSFLTSGGLGTMGYGFPAAIGAAFAGAGGPVSCIAGDGSLMMNIQELDTCRRHNIPVKVFVLNNSCLGMVRQWQQLFYEHRYSHTLYSCDPDFKMIAEGMGVRGFAESNPEKVKSVIEAALETPGPALVDFKIPQEAMVMPMIPAGGALDEMIMG